MKQQEKTNQMMFRELERIKESKKLVETTTPLQPRILNFDSTGFSGNHQGDIIPMQTRTTTVGPTPVIRVTTNWSLGITPGSSSQDPNIGNTFNQFLDANELRQDTGISPIMSKELKKLRDMISSVPGVVQPILEASSASHRISRFAPPVCDAEIPKRF
ncbi:hypothetical protein L1987_18472 [Smallanthus sonchifolius]|uniref:Uncharacterized protein n=1 Tax=Smallanthus sonchifolius TaxID=185202 RepID=A0ACB9J2E4_9ASTR|nr:hypothetical protein L1987_18472 [Smallanthus sonchifolius]